MVMMKRMKVCLFADIFMIKLMVSLFLLNAEKQGLDDQTDVHGSLLAEFIF